jgi:acyl carrier protein
MTVKQQVLASAAGIRPLPGGREERLMELPLTGREMGYSGIDLVYLMMELMGVFGIRFEAADVEAYRFNTLPSITRMIEAKIQTQKSNTIC